jgi:hypothetical protein
MAEASCALHKVPALLRLHLDLLGKLEESLVLDSKLAKASLTPAPDVTFLSDGETEERTACNVADGPAIEGTDVVRS